MKIGVVVFRTVILTLILAGAAPCGADAANTLLRDRDFCCTSSFASWRFGHLHAGIDLSTGGVNGALVMAIDSCWVWRVSVRNEGYGRSIYLRLPDGKIAVYGHLSRFAPDIERAVEQEQDLRGSYSVDVYYEPYAFTFGKGDVLGLSGESGWGPPHLHFELRSGMYDHLKINPFPYYVECVDSRPPVVHAVKVVPVGPGSSVNGDFVHTGTVARPVADPAAPDTLYVSGDFGIMVSASDYTGCGRITSPVFYEARVDTSVVWRLNLNKFPFAKRNLVWSIYHLDESGSKYVRLFNPFKLDFNEFDISRPDTGFGGFAPGIHELQVTVADACGNKAYSVVPFYYGDFPILERLTCERSSSSAIVEVGFSPPDAQVEVWYREAGSPWTAKDAGDGGPKGRASGRAGVASSEHRVTFPVGGGAVDIKCRISNELGFAREGLFRLYGPDSASHEAELRLTVTGSALEITALSAMPPSELPVARIFEGIRVTRLPLQPVGDGVFRGMYVPACVGDAIQAQAVFRYGRDQYTAIAGTPVACLERASSAVLLTETFRLRIEVPRDMRPDVILGYEEGSPAHYEGFTDSLGCLVFRPAGTFFGDRARVCLALREGSMTVKQGVFADRGEAASFIARADSSGVVCFETDFLEKLVVLEDRERPKIVGFEGKGRREDGRFIFEARALDAGSGVDPETVKAFVDGQTAIAGYDPDTGRVEGRTTKPLREGEHRFTLEVKDRMGNRTSSEHTLTLK